MQKELTFIFFNYQLDKKSEWSYDQTVVNKSPGQTGTKWEMVMIFPKLSVVNIQLTYQLSGPSLTYQTLSSCTCTVCLHCLMSNYDRNFRCNHLWFHLQINVAMFPFHNFSGWYKVIMTYTKRYTNLSLQRGHGSKANIESNSFNYKQKLDSKSN